MWRSGYDFGLAETVYIVYVLFLLTCLLTPQTLNTIVCFSNVLVVTIFSLDRNETLDFRFDIYNIKHHKRGQYLNWMWTFI